MVELNFNIPLVRTTPTCFHWFLCCNSWVPHVTFYMHRHDTPMHENITSKFSEREPCHENKLESLDVAQHKPYINVFHNAWTLLLMDNSIPTLSIELTRQINTHHNKYVSTFIQSVVGNLLDSRNVVTASKSNVAHFTTILKWCKLFWACDMYTLIFFNNC